MGQGVVDALDAGFGAAVVRACVDLVDTKAFVDGVESFEVNCSPLSDMRVTGHPHRGMYWSMRMSAVPAAVNWAAATAFKSARRLKRSVKRKM